MHSGVLKKIGFTGTGVGHKPWTPALPVQRTESKQEKAKKAEIDRLEVQDWVKHMPAVQKKPNFFEGSHRMPPPMFDSYNYNSALNGNGYGFMSSSISMSASASASAGGRP